jgi:hypothetical protein
MIGTITSAARGSAHSDQKNTASYGPCNDSHNPFKNVPENGEVFEPAATMGHCHAIDDSRFSHAQGYYERRSCEIWEGR